MVHLDDGIELLNGNMFSFHSPDASTLEVEELAHVLSNVCRFAGHVRYFYSVAQHAVNVSLIVDRAHAKTALLHDTAEGFTNDIVTPLKHMVSTFREIEERIESAMAAHFGFQYPLPDEVKWADLAMLKLEKEHLKPSASSWGVLDGIDAEPVRHLVNLEPMSPTEARDAFIARWKEVQ